MFFPVINEFYRFPADFREQELIDLFSGSETG